MIVLLLVPTSQYDIVKPTVTRAITNSSSPFSAERVDQYLSDQRSHGQHDKRTYRKSLSLQMFDLFMNQFDGSPQYQ